MDPTAAFPPLVTPDGVRLPADLAAPDGAIAGAVLLHPHPRFGGDRHNIVVDALFRALPAAGIAALRFDFRPGAGAEGGDLGDERVDTVAALDALASHVAAERLVVVGYSFGAAVGLTVEHPAIVARVAIAPPVSMMRVEPASPAPTLVLVPEADQFSPPDVARPIVTAWPGATLEVIDGADHFLAGHAADTAQRAAAWLRGVLA